MAEVLASLKKIGGSGEKYTETVLWTNPSPTSARSGTNTITLSESYENYDLVKITFKYTNDSDPGNVKSVYIPTTDLHVSYGPTVALSRINASGTYVASRYIYSDSYTTIKDVCVGGGNPTTTAIITEVCGVKIS